MKVTQGQLLEAINEFIDTDILAHTNAMGSLEQFMFGVKVGVIKRSLPNKLNDYLNGTEVKTLGIVDDDGIDVDIIYGAAKDAMARVGTIEYNSIRFNVSDIDKLYSIISKRRGVVNV